jgi:hypothetical protein
MKTIRRHFSGVEMHTNQPEAIIREILESHSEAYESVLRVKLAWTADMQCASYDLQQQPIILHIMAVK